MKDKIFILTIAALGAVLGGCVNVDKSVSETPYQYWKAPQNSVPKESVAPERIKTEKIESQDDYKKSQEKVEADKAQAAEGKWQPQSPSEKLLVGRELDLSDLVDIALENNTVTRVYWFQAKSYAAAKGKAYSAYYPQVSVGAQVYRSKTKPSVGYATTPAIGSYYETGYGPSAEINWLIYDFGKREAQVESARQALLAANFDYNQSVQDVVLNVNVAYYNYYNAVGSVKAAEMGVRDAQTAYDAAKARFDAAVGNKPDMLNALANMKSSEYVLEQAKAQVETTRADLARVLGIRISESFNVSGEAKIPTDAETAEKVDALIYRALHSRQTLLAAYAQLRKAESDTDIARRNFLPQIGAQGTAAYTWYTQDGRQDQYGYQVGLNLSWSVFEGFARKYDLISAKAAERAKAQQLKAAEIEIISDIWTYYHLYLSALKQVQTTQAAIDASQEAYDATKVGYDNGVNNITELLNSQNRLSDARQQMVNAQSTLASSIARLAHATGALQITSEEEPELTVIPEKKDA